MRNACSIRDCDEFVAGRGYCKRHYSNWWRTGDPIPRQIVHYDSVGERLKSKLVPAGDCWEFTGWTSPLGYGKFRARGTTEFAHRVAYREWVGPIPDGMHICHTCDNPPCCNPAHLFAGTHQDNMDDMARKGRRRPAQNPDRSIGRRTQERFRLAHAAATEAAGVPIEWKFCRRCEAHQPRDNFGRNAGRKDGLQVYCRPCWRAYIQQRRAA